MDFCRKAVIFSATRAIIIIIIIIVIIIIIIINIFLRACMQR